MVMLPGREWYGKWREMSKMIICVQKSSNDVDFGKNKKILL